MIAGPAAAAASFEGQKAAHHRRFEAAPTALVPAPGPALRQARLHAPGLAWPGASMFRAG